MTQEERRQRRKAIARDARTGATWAELTKRYRLSYSAIEKACYSHGSRPPSRKARGRGKGTLAPLRILAELRKADVNGAAIARRCGLSRAYVHEVKKQAVRLGLLEVKP